VRAREMESSKKKHTNKIQIQFKIKNPNQLGEPKASLDFCFNFCRAYIFSYFFFLALAIAIFLCSINKLSFCVPPLPPAISSHFDQANLFR